MNKRLKFFVSLSLIFAIFVSSFIMPATSYTNEIETSTADMLMVNMDTETVVFSQKPDNKWYMGYLSELMTFLLAYENIEEPDTVFFKPEKSFADSLPFSDGCLEKFYGKTISAKDLMAIMLLTSGSDAAYALADIVSDGDVASFVDDMNAKAAELGCGNTSYASPGFDDSLSHVTTCRDLYTVYKQVNKIKLYYELMQSRPYNSRYLENVDDEEDYSVEPVASILRSESPYYFRYVNDAMVSYSEKTYASIVLSTTYRGMTYFYAGLLGMNESERNVYSDARKLTTWAYLNLSDRKMLNSEQSMSEVLVKTGWGEYMVNLNPMYSAFKTLPNDYDDSKLMYTFEIPDYVEAPLRAGQSIGKAVMIYDGEAIQDDVQLIVTSDEGLGMLSDFGRFSSYVYSALTPREVPTEAPEEQPTEESTEISDWEEQEAPTISAPPEMSER